MIKLLAPLTGLLAGRARLFFSYGLIAVIVTLAATVITMWFQARELGHQNETLHTRVMQNHELIARQAITIEELQDQRRRDDLATKALLERFEKLGRSDKDIRNKLRSLEARNADVRSVLDTPLPDELRGLLNAGRAKTQRK